MNQPYPQPAEQPEPHSDGVLSSHDREWVASVAQALGHSTPGPAMAMRDVRVAGIVIDQISTRLIVADARLDAAGNPNLTLVARRTAMTILGGTARERGVDPMALARTLDIVSHFYEIAHSAGAEEPLVSVHPNLVASAAWRMIRYELEHRLGEHIALAEPHLLGDSLGTPDLAALATRTSGWMLDAGSDSCDIVLLDGTEPIDHHRLTGGFMRTLERLFEAGETPAHSVVSAMNHVERHLTERFAGSTALGPNIRVGLACNFERLEGPLRESQQFALGSLFHALPLEVVAGLTFDEANDRSAQPPRTELATSLMLEGVMRHFGLTEVIASDHDALLDTALLASVTALDAFATPSPQPVVEAVPVAPALNAVPVPQMPPQLQQTAALPVTYAPTPLAPAAHPPVAHLAPAPPVYTEPPVPTPVVSVHEQPPTQALQDEAPDEDAPISTGRRIFKWFMRLFTFCAFMMLILVVAVTWGTRVSHYRTYVILGKSMEPTIPIGAVAILKPVPRNTIKKGDIITYQHTKTNGTAERITHRVVGIRQLDKRAVFKTKGDANRTKDPWEADYIDDKAWKVRAHIPYLGYLLMAIQSKLGRIVVIVIPAILLFAMFVRWLWSEDEEPEAEVKAEHMQHVGVNPYAQQQMPWPGYAYPQQHGQVPPQYAQQGYPPQAQGYPPTGPMPGPMQYPPHAYAPQGQWPPGYQPPQDTQFQQAA